MLSSPLRLGLPNALFPSGLTTKTLCAPLLSPLLATCPAHFIYSIGSSEQYLLNIRPAAQQGRDADKYCKSALSLLCSHDGSVCVNCCR